MTVGLKFRNKVLLGKTEAAYGVEEVLDGSVDAVLTRELSIEPSKGETEELNYDNGGIGHGVQRKTTSHIGISGNCDFAGSGDAAVPPAWGFLLKACGFDETINAGPPAEVIYAFTNNPDSLTLAYQNERNLHPGVGARGMVTLDMTPGRFPSLGFNFEALRVAPSDAAFPTVSASAWKKPSAVNFANTTTARLFGYDVALTALSFDFGNQVPVINVPGANFIDINGRAPTANITILAPGIAEKDFYAIEDAGDLGAFEVVHGIGAGNVLTLGSPALTQLTNLQLGEYQGRTALTATLRFVDGDDGQSDFTIKQS